MNKEKNKRKENRFTWNGGEIVILKKKKEYKYLSEKKK